MVAELNVHKSIYAFFEMCPFCTKTLNCNKFFVVLYPSFHPHLSHQSSSRNL